MEKQNYRDISRYEETNWWYVSRRRILQDMFRRVLGGGTAGSVVDVGCGTGANVSVLRQHAARVVGIDIAPEAVAFAREKGGYTEVLCGDALALPLPDASVDIVVCMDVLEHVDDEAAAREIARVLRPGGYAFITVPAFASLWNVNDDYSHHLRRYRSQRLGKIFQQAGCVAEKVYYWNCALVVPVWVMARLYRRGQTPLRNNLSYIPGVANPLLRWLIRAELVAGTHLPFGVSLCAVVRKG